MAIQSAERVSPDDMSDNYVFQRSLLAYRKAAEIVSGDVLEIGTGSGYGIEILSPRAVSFTTIDKHPISTDMSPYPNAVFLNMKVPPLTDLSSTSYDCVVSFQVIEHIAKDFDMLSEIYRVLRPGGKLIISTPNRDMSLTRNPWHVREYSPDEFKNLLASIGFNNIEALGVFGNEKVMSYYRKNRQAVRKITRFDFLNLQYNLPRWLLKIPYDMLNRMNRRKLLEENTQLVTEISAEDYFMAPVAEKCFDLFYIAEK